MKAGEKIQKPSSPYVVLAIMHIYITHRITDHFNLKRMSMTPNHKITKPSMAKPGFVPAKVTKSLLAAWCSLPLIKQVQVQL